MRSLFTSRPKMAGLVVLAVAGFAAFGALRTRMAVDPALTAVVRRGTLAPTLTVGGALRAADAVTYRSPLAGRDTEITFLVAEGTRVNEGDLLIRFDRVAVDRELERAAQDVRQARVDLQLAEIDRREGQAAIESLAGGEAAINAEENRVRLQAAEMRAERLREELKTLQPLMDKGFITRDELRRTADELQQAEADLTIAKRRAELLVERTLPRDRQKAALLLAQKEAQRDNVLARLRVAEARLAELQAQAEGSSVYAKAPGLVVYEEFMNANPRRKIRAGDRVSDTPGIVTVADVERMLVEASVDEANIHRVAVGQQATVEVEAFRGRRFNGTIVRVGTLARASSDQGFEDKRFDLIVALTETAPELKPEMTARVDVQLPGRSDVLIVPSTAIFDQRGQPTAHVVNRLGVEQRAVQVGQSTPTEVEIVAGIDEGDRVMLTAPVEINRPAAPGGGSGGAPRSGVRMPVPSGGQLRPQ